MAQKHSNETEGSNLGDSGLQEDIAHWAEVLDQWVAGIDTRLGRNGSGKQLAGLDGDGHSLDGGPS